MAESGWFYASFIDPLLKNMRRQTSNQIEFGEKVIDVACGTGAQVFEFSKKASKAVGIDLSESMIKWAKKKNAKKKLSTTEFYIADATNLSNFLNDEFDVAVMSLALHQFDPELHGRILAEMKRIATRFVIVDYAVPLPNNYAGYGSKIAEFFAGGKHHTNFKRFYRLGGLNRILPDNSLQILKSDFLGEGAFQLVVCS